MADVEKTKEAILAMKVGEVKQIKDWSAYAMLVDLYCEGLPILLDDKRGTIERVDEDFNQRRLNYTKQLNESFRKGNKSYFGH